LPYISYTIPVQTGLNLIANQLDHGSNRLNEILTGLPDGCALYKYNNAAGNWDSSTYSAAQQSWQPTNIVLNPGEGAFFQSPSNFTLVFTGNPHVPVLPVAIPSGAAYLLSRQTNDVGDYTSIVGMAPTNGALLHRWTGTSYATYTFTASAWSPSNPVVAVGESVWISPMCGVPPPLGASYAINLNAGYNLIANQLDHGSNALNDVMPQVPDGSVLHKYNNGSGIWTEAAYSTALGSWTPATFTLSPGEGAFFQSPAAFTLVFHGTPHVPVLPITIPNGSTYLLSRQTNDVGDYTSIVGLAPANGASLSRWTGSSYIRYTFSGGVWSPSTPSVPVGQAVWITSGGSTQPPATPAAYAVTLQKGYTPIANQLDYAGPNAGGNSLNNIMPAVPDGSGLYKFDNSHGTWVQAFYNASSGSWTPNNVTLNPGEGAFFQSPAAFQLTLAGRPHVPVLPVAISTGSWGLLSRQTNDVGTYANIVGTPPLDGARIFRGSPPTYSSSVFVVSNGWHDAILGTPQGTNGPSIPVGQAAWFANSSAAPAQPPALPNAELLLSIQRLTNGWVLEWNSVAGTLYRLQTTTNLALPGAWTTLAVASASAASTQWIDYSPTDRTRFYRVIVPGPTPATIEPAIVTANTGAMVYIPGYNLGAAGYVLIGGQIVSNLTVVSPTLLQGTLPSLAPGVYSAQLFNGSGQLLAVLANAVEVVTNGSPALLVEPPEPTPADPSAGSCARAAQKDPTGVHLFSGEIHYTATDLSIPAVGMDLIWSRSYRSMLGLNTSQGNNWTFSYNISIQHSQTNILLIEGNARQDVYYQQPDGSYARNGFMREGRFLGNGFFQLTFPDNSSWTLYPLDGSFVAGKISTIVDRNGNGMSFAYDGLGRLINITDTLGRSTGISYNGDGFISTVTDFSGRQISYTYYHNGDANGSFGDLASVTSPAVTGTPNGNDFPSGKTTIYTYSTGFADPRLNHKLLTVTDPKGQTWLQNIYSTESDPSALYYGRLVARIWGYGSEILTYTYTNQTPSPANNFATLKTIVNDRLGNVSESVFDSRNRLVIHREFTGRAVAGQPTTDTLNRPTGQLRASDPAFFETRSLYNDDFLPTLVTNPNGNTVQNFYELDFNPAAARRTRGNLRVENTSPGPLGGDQALQTVQHEYDPGLGGCCGFNFVIKSTDAIGNITRYAYDSRGNRTNIVHPIPTVVDDYTYNAAGQETSHTMPDNGSGHRQVDQMVYYATGPQTGYLQAKIKDAGGFALTDTYFYDAVGNIIRHIDPRGNDTLFSVNALNQVVRELSPEVTTGSGIRYQHDTAYDANDNIVSQNLLNLDEFGALVATNAFFTTNYQYDILNSPTQVLESVDATKWITNAYQYDANRNRTLEQFGEATAGHDPFNIVKMLYDERNLLFQEIHGAGSPSQSTTQHDYDPNRNHARLAEGLESNPRVSTRAYDGFNQETKLTDPMGNQTLFHYDANGNELSEVVQGRLLDGTAWTNSVRLAETRQEYDAMDRPIRETTHYFNATSQGPIASGSAIFQFAYSAAGRVTRTVDEKGFAATTTYDTLNRKSVTIDAAGNSVTNIHDANNNVIQTAEVEVSSLGAPSQLIMTRHTFDNLNRETRKTDNLGNITLKAYDSHDNEVTVTDPRTNVIHYAYDGLKRLVKTTRILTSTGDGSGSPVGSITTTQTFDDSSRLISETDDNGNATTYAYDSLNRRVLTTFADTTTATTQYDVHNDPVFMTDANGNQVTSVFDSNSRLTSRSIVLGPGVVGPTSETYAYDGLGRRVQAQDNDSQVTFTYDSLSQITTETQQVLPSGPVRSIGAQYDEAGNKLVSTYPGGRTITRAYDQLHRVQSISDGAALVASFNYLGPSRVQQRDRGNGTRLAIAYDGVRRATNYLHSVIASHNALDQRQYAWDGADNKTLAVNPLVNPVDHRNLQYDSDNRLVDSQRLPFGPTIAYAFDGANNRTFVSGGPDAGSYYMDPTTPLPDDRAMNRYTDTPFDQRHYDRNGNLVQAGNRFFQYNFRNQLTVAIDTVAATTNIYKYDLLHRRLEKSSNGSVTRYYYDGVQQIEEQNAVGTTLATYVWDGEQVLQMTRGGQNWFYHEDADDSIGAMTDQSGNVVERYDYDDYGVPGVFDGAGNPLAASAIGNPFLYIGQRFDAETGFYYCHSRFYEPRTGRFITPDTIGIWADEHNLGNGYTYARNNPWSYSDRSGERTHKQRVERRKERRAIRKEYRHKRHELRKEYRHKKREVRKAKRECVREGYDRKMCRDTKHMRMRALRDEYTRWTPGDDYTTTECQSSGQLCMLDSECYDDKGNYTGPCAEVTYKGVFGYQIGKGKFAELHHERKDKLHDLRWWR
jgi:RHS repeat-associated protein